MKHTYPHTSLGIICGLFGKTRQGWYAQSRQAVRTTLEHATVLELVREIRKTQPGAGTPTLHKMLRDLLPAHHIKMGRAALNDLLSEHGMLIRKKYRKPKTTDSVHWYRRYDNLIKGIEINRPCQVWVSDITYITLSDGFAYLSLITDGYSRKIPGYVLCETLASTGPLQALSMALKGTDRSAGSLIHHSDRGVQYCCTEYTGTLQAHGISISMARKGDPYENPIAERVNGLLKTHFGIGIVFATIAGARAAIDQAIRTYNTVRPHSSCEDLTPEQAHEQSGPLLRRWKNYKKLNKQKQ
jgi:putative transposase